MAKKRVKKKSSRRNVVSAKKIATTRKVNLVVKNIILFLILFLVSLGLYSVSSNEILFNLFWMISMISGFVLVAFVIVYLIFFFMRIFRK